MQLKMCVSHGNNGKEKGQIIYIIQSALGWLAVRGDEAVGAEH